MSRDRDLASDTLEDAAQLRAWILDGSKGPDATLGVGVEHEKVGFADLDATPIRFDGERGIATLLDRLADRYGWTRLYDGGHLMALERDGAAITLEPGGQLELSGAIQPDVFGVQRELQNHLHEVRSVSKELGLEWMFAGVNPWRGADEIPWVPKPRYDVMKQYLPRRGPLAAWMMKTTASIQANFDFRDERDAMQILRVGALASPLVTAIFANSPIREGKETGLASFRMAIWEDTDRDRCGTPGFMLDPDASVQDYVEWVLDVPMFFIKRENRYIDMAGYSFRRFFEEGFEGHRANIGDWELHLSTAFPDIRLKSYIETRTTDIGMPAHILALTALWKGLFYDQEAREEVFALPLARDVHESDGLIRMVREAGLNGELRGRSVRDLSGELIAIARRGLTRQQCIQGDEAAFLDVLFGANGNVENPGERFLADWRATKGDPRILIPKWGLRDDNAQP